MICFSLTFNNNYLNSLTVVTDLLKLSSDNDISKTIDNKKEAPKPDDKKKVAKSRPSKPKKKATTDLKPEITPKTISTADSIIESIVNSTSILCDISSPLELETNKSVETNNKRKSTNSGK